MESKASFANSLFKATDLNISPQYLNFCAQRGVCAGSLKWSISALDIVRNY